MTKITTIRDEQETNAQGMADALLHRMAPTTKLTENGQRFRHMTLLELARESLEVEGLNVRGKDRMEVAALALQSRNMGTSDFPSILANVGNKRMRLAYQQNPATYQLWARRAADLPDFKSVTAVQISSAPDLLRVNEDGEFQYGKMQDGAESYSLITYGRIVALTRQAMVNDDLRAFDTALAGFGSAAARLENRLVYAQLTGNAPMADGNALFDAQHKNAATGAGSALGLDALSAMRASMRQQRGLQSETLNIAPSFLIVPAALEQDAYKLTSANYTPSRFADVNEFREGGRSSLTPVVEPLLDNVSATQWYAAANNGQVDTVEYCYLAGTDGPVLETWNPFNIDAMNMKCRLDFAAKAIDYRGLYRADGK
ncbi:hypothetical protein HH212_12105 [Massilia forsythiae]|uniref:Bacteriophage Mu GpT domain-containing protein n=1 Tax=Massilia forsythiae TaxID=2728020 RepID=A0A7Z2ZU46_9BURK|nr:Mu-like prophage major head subunit gpT family protein [Massilia forsythiae]QJE00672.1 hypothetical protein HH212_12105 [Massilia forsythiae]